ncbi:MAG: DUF2066 domain-containing protein, partial [Gammaproteobacteria bacterium]|nr:DUF2066 domain-containing protein [Gammaproteobacteria bacterium]
MTAPRPFALVLMLSLALLAMGAAPGRAATGELFAAEVEVPDASAEARGEGVVDAFATVLTKVTGRPDAESFAAWPQLRDAADRLMIEYRYRTEAPPSSVAEPTAPPRTLLYVRFDRQGIESLLRQNRLPLWGDTRPATLLLLAVERGTERFIYTPDAMPEAARAISEASKRRGIPIVEPLMDLEDRGMLRFNEVWGGFPEVIEQVTARYAQDALLVGRLFSEGGDAWRAQWTLHVDGARDQWQSQGALAETLREGVHGLADLLARRYVPDAASAEER